MKEWLNNIENFKDELIQLYSQDLAQANHDKNELKVEVKRLNKELSEFHRVLNSDETLKALFDEQKGKI